MPTPKPGEHLQQLVEVIERATHYDANVLVESPKRLPDKDTGTLREHDVVLTFTQRHHKLAVALECRDRGRRTGVPDVEAFRLKCLRTGIDRGVMVSSTGFTKTALVKAASLHIGCLSLDQAAGFDWCSAPGVERRQRHLISAYAGMVIERDLPPLDGRSFYMNDGTRIDQERVTQFALNALNSLQPDMAEAANKPISRRFLEQNPPIYTLDDATGDRVAVKELRLEVAYENRVTLFPFDFHQYVDRAGGRELSTAAIASVDDPGFKGRVILLREEGKGEGEGAKVMFVLDKRD